MLRTTLITSTLIIGALAASGCEKKPAPVAEQQDTQVQAIAAEPAPNAMERTAAGAANEVEQATTNGTPVTPAELAAGLSATKVPAPATALSTASVKTQDGQNVGEVRSVVVGPSGMADAIIVEAGGFLNVGERAVTIEAGKFTYLKDRNILVLSLTKAELEKLPATPAAQN